MLRLTKKQNIIYIKKLRKQQWKTQKKGRNELSSQIVFFPLWYTGWAIVNYCTPYIYHLFSRQKKKKQNWSHFFFFFELSMIFFKHFFFPFSSDPKQPAKVFYLPFPSLLSIDLSEIFQSHNANTVQSWSNFFFFQNLFFCEIDH